MYTHYQLKNGLRMRGRIRSSEDALSKARHPWGAISGTLISGLLGVVVFAGTLFHGSVVEGDLFSLFAGLLVVALTACWFVFPPMSWRLGALLILGSFLLLNVILQPAIRSAGFLLLAAAWLALFSALLLSEAGLSRARLVLFAIVVLGLFQAGVGLAQSIQDSSQLSERIFEDQAVAVGTFVNRNHFAALLNMTLMVALGGMLTAVLERSGHGFESESLSKVWAWAVCCTTIALAVVFTFSRGGVATLVGSFLFFGTAVLWKFRRVGRATPYLASLLIVALLIISLGSWIGFDYLFTRFGDAESDASLRFPVYRDTLNLILDNPLIGVGPGMYRWRFRQYQSENLGKLFDHAHNDYLEFSAEWGLPLAILFWCLVAWRALDSYRLFLKSRNPIRQGMALGCSAAILSILLHSLLDFNLQIPANFVVFGIVMAVSWGISVDHEKRKSLEHRSLVN